MEHFELIQEMPSIERMSAQERLKLAKKRRMQQLKRWAQYEKQLEKGSVKKFKKKATPQTDGKKTRSGSKRVKFAENIALLEAAARNDSEEVNRLLQNGVSPDVTNEDGLTALHQCCIDDNEEMLKLLLNYRANVNACDSEMWTPLHAAATCGHVTLCKHLVDRGAELLAVNADGNMPYDICEDEVTLDYIESEMAKRGITQEQIDNTRLTTERQMLADIKEIVAKGGDLEARDALGATMLHVAAANGYMEVAEFLLDHHVSVDSRDNESWQPIHAAAYWGQLEILELLVQNGADLDAKTKNGETPFDLSEDPEIKQRILDLKDEIETKRASRRPGSSRRQKHNSRNASIHHHHQDSMYSSNSSLNSKTSNSASMRRSSLRGDKSNLFKKEAQEEALHFGLRLMQDEEELGVLVEEKENLPATNLDDVTISFDDSDKPSLPKNPATSLTTTTYRSDQDSAKVNNAKTAAPKTNFPEDNRNYKQPASNTNYKSAGNQNTSNTTGPQGSNDIMKQQNVVNEPPSKDQFNESAEDIIQKMFLERVPQINSRSSRASVISNSSQNQQLHIYKPPMMTLTMNGVNNNTPSIISSTHAKPVPHANVPRTSFREGQLRRFVAPASAPPVGEDDPNKHRCCVIL
ncbi:unnamed protein product [Candidula unifasciata]|uniref:Protein phosphatase 1 regulatory subunit 16A n=1 Tax=Candidula unifasciata TaxID=100452 RepID=A0A8S4A6N2_9EUPU|nr:unnamed protein product [Candidula unifasciata]